MALYRKKTGVWEECVRPYAKMNGVWVACDEAYVKRSGAWVRAYEYDVTPPPQPAISLEVVESKSGGEVQTRYIKVGMRMPGTSHDPDVKLIRLLTTHDGHQPTNQFSGTYWSNSDDNYPSEPWSDWKYGIYGAHNDTSNWQYKQWPVNASSGTIIQADKRYYFSAWALDDAENWGGATHSDIYVDKPTVNAPQYVTREAFFQANASGSWKGDKNVWNEGDLLQQNSPRSIGVYFYGNQLFDTIGVKNKDSVNISKAQIYIKRRGAQQDNGQANANVTTFYDSKGNSGLLAPNGPAKNGLNFLGTLEKGTGSWFSLPQGYLNIMHRQSFGCLGLDYHKPGAAQVAADFSKMIYSGENGDSGKLHVVWTEEQ